AGAVGGGGSFGLRCGADWPGGFEGRAGGCCGSRNRRFPEEYFFLYCELRGKIRQHPLNSTDPSEPVERTSIALQREAFPGPHAQGCFSRGCCSYETES